MPGELLTIVGLAVLGALLGAVAVPWWAARELRSDARVGPAARIAAAVLLAAAFGLLGWRMGPAWLLPGVLAFAVVGAAVSVVDLLERRIPNRMLLVGGVAVGVLVVVPFLVAGDGWGVLWAAAGAAAMFGLYLVLALVSPSAMGMGDVKLAALVGGVLGAFGWTTWFIGLLAAFVLGGVAALALLLARRAGRRDTIPFGPWMVAGALVAAVLPT